MKVYKLTDAILAEEAGVFFRLPEKNWDTFISDENVLANTRAAIANLSPCEDAQALIAQQLDAPVQSQELWASGVTYFRSKQGRQEESEKSGGSDFYARVYEAERPELFFKATRHRIVGHGGLVRIRRDSTWDVPEPELVLVLSPRGRIIGYTIGNDMSSRSIEGENPLYLPQAKTYDGCAAIGPCVLLTDEALSPETEIQLTIYRDGELVFGGAIAINQIKRRFEELAGYLFRECSFPRGALLMTGTGIVPDSGFTLRAGDEIVIDVSAIGSLVNRVAQN